jgi:hypothetical protein
VSGSATQHPLRIADIGRRSARKGIVENSAAPFLGNVLPAQTILDHSHSQECAHSKWADCGAVSLTQPAPTHAPSLE